MSTLQITTIQSTLFWEDKQANLNMFEDKIKGLQHKGGVVILPEMFSTGFSMNTTDLAETMDGNTLHWMKRVSKENNIILTGSVIISENNQFFNRLIWMLPNQTFGFYDKRHLFAYAGENQFYSSGNKRLIASVNGWKLNLNICYDLRFPVWARQQQENEYDVLVYVANWPEKRNHAWKSLLTARAIENQCYVVGVNRVGVDGKGINYSGDTMVVDPLGVVLYHKENEEDIFTTLLQKEALQSIRQQFPFSKDADGFTLSNFDE
jgi:predicted amidohydrolase